MISRDPSCVFVAADAAQAAVVANWLEHQGVPAQVMDTMTLGGLEGLTAWTGISARGIEVWVVRQADAEVACTMIAEHDQALSALLAGKASAGAVSAHCEECGCTSEFPGQQRGTVQNCPHCGRYLDVPDGDAPDEGGVEDSTDAQSQHADADATAASAMPLRPSRLRRLQKPIILFFLFFVALYLFAVFTVGAGSFFRALLR